MVAGGFETTPQCSVTVLPSSAVKVWGGSIICGLARKQKKNNDCVYKHISREEG